MNLPLFIARHIYSDDNGKRKVSRPAVRIAMLGIAVGLAVMIISVSVVVGFKHTIRDKVVGFGSHLIVADFMTLQGNEEYPICMDDSMMNVLRHIEGVKHVQRYAYKQGMLKTDSDFLGVMFKGVGPDFDPSFLQEHLIDGTIPTFSAEKSTNQLLISKPIADKLRLKSGEKVFAYFINNDDVRTRRFTIAGIYQTNLKRFDEALCFTDIYTTVRLNGWERDQASGAELTINDFDKLDETARTLTKSINHTIDKYGETYSSTTVKHTNPQIFAWLDLLDLNVWIILGLMTAVACVTMISGLLIIILERTQMIGTMKALGAKNRTIRHTFLWFAVFIIGKGMLLGNILGIGLCLLQQFTGIIKLDPSSYYVSTVPIELNPLWILLLNVSTLLISIIILIAPSYLISHIHPARSIRYE